MTNKLRNVTCRKKCDHTRPDIIHSHRYDQGGEGFVDSLKNLFNGAKRIATKVVDAATSETGTAIQNAVLSQTNKNPLWKPGFPGEKHAILQTDYGLTKGSWIGPGTNIDARLARGDQGITPVDQASKRHDLRYSLAKDVSDIRKADVAMLREVAASNDRPFNKALGNIGIGGKIALESGGFAKPEDFTTFGGLTDPVKRAKYEAALKQAGGKKVKPPGHKLKNKLIKQVAAGKLKPTAKNTNRASNMEGEGIITDGLEYLSSKAGHALLPLVKKLFQSRMKQYNKGT
jgi:hypothetical protein